MNPRNAWFVVGFVTGCAVAGAITLLYAPARGQDTRAAIRRHWENAKREAQAAGSRAEADVLTRYRTLRSASLTITPSGSTSDAATVGGPKLADARA